MSKYIVSYEFPLGCKNKRRVYHTYDANSEAEAKLKSGVQDYNPTLKVRFVSPPPAPKRIVQGTYSDAPCKENCWHATGLVCVCSCAGENHGIGHSPESK
jgi:hypothetical protein